MFLFVVKRLGYYLPWGIVGLAVAAIGTGLISTFDPHTSTGKWVGYQIIAGAGRGAGQQVVCIPFFNILMTMTDCSPITQPIIAVQNAVSPAEISVGMSMLMFFQTLAGAIVFTLYDVIFSNGLKTLIPKEAPGVNVQAVIAAGAKGIRAAVSEKDLPAVLSAYAQSVDHAFYMATAIGVCGVFFACGLGWKDIREKPTADDKIELERLADKAPEEQV